MKAATLESKFPILSVEHDCIISKDADITVCYRVELPELFTVTQAEYEAIHSAWAKAVKVLPNYSIVHKQDFFIEESYTPELQKEDLSFLSRSFERHFNERPYLKHTCYLFLTKTTKEHSRTTSSFNALTRGFIIPKEMQDKEVVSRFLECCEQFERIINDSGFITLTRLTGDEITGTESTAGIIEKYFSLSQEDTTCLQDITLGAGEMKIGDETFEKSAYQIVPIYKVEPNPDQPRQDFDQEELQALADSIAVHGVIQPLTVRELPGGYYQIIAGERRWRAARLASLSEIPVVIMEADDRKVMELALIENLQRQDLNPMEEAMGYQSLMEEYGLTQEEAAKRVGKSRPAVANALRLLGLADSVKEMVRRGELTAGHARAVLSLKSEKKQQEAAQKIHALGLSVRQAELICKNMSKEPQKEEKEEVFRVDYVAECEKQLSKQLGRGVKIVNGKRKGRFELEFYDQDDMQNLLDALMKLKK